LALTGPWTVIRMIGEYIIAPTTAPVALDKVRMIVGIGVVSTDAATVGASALPDPGAEPDYPWLYWKDHPVQYASTEVDPAGEAGTVRASFDIHSMRKIKPRESLVFVFEYNNVNGDPPLTAGVGLTRVLVATG